jgi:hypothetical protein
MTQTGSISGRIFDRDGEPASSISVQALRLTYSTFGGSSFVRPSLTIAQSAQSNDLGEYRLFWLPPGRYYVTARLGGASSLVNSPADRISNAVYASSPILTQRTENGELIEESNRSVYYPGSTDAAAASPIDLGFNSNVSGIDLILAAPVPTRHVRGFAVNSVTGRVAADALVVVAPRNVTHDMAVSAGRTDENGVFDIPGVVPGPHFLAATVGDGELTGYLPIVVGSGDLENVAIVVTPGFDIPGKVVFEGAPANLSESLPRVIPEVQRDPVIPRIPFPQPSGTVPPNLAPDNSFVIRGLGPGDYRVFVREISFPQQRIYVKSIRLGDADVLNEGLHIEGKPESRLEIVLGTDVAALLGNVVNAKNEPIANATVAMVPYLRTSHRPDLFKNVTTDGAGRFHIEGIAPGDYVVLAWEDVEFGAWHDPEFVRRYASLGRTIHISGGTTEHTTLTVSQ